MHPRFPLTVVALLLVGGAVFAQSAPRAEFDTTELDFGTIRQGQRIERRVVLRNIGSAPLRILGVDLTPPLQLASMPAYIQPGAEVPVNLTLDARALDGPFEGEVRFRYSDPSTPMSVLMVTGTIVPPLEFRPRKAFFLSAQKGHSAESTIEIINHDDRPLTITKAEHDADRFTTILEPVEPGKRYRLKLVLKPDAAIGQRRDRITLHTIDAQRQIDMIAHTRVRERVYAFPDAVDMGSLPKSAISGNPAILEQATQTLMVYQEGGTDFRASFFTDVPHLTITAERGPKGDRWQAAIRLRPGGEMPDTFSGTITVMTNDPEVPVLTVPVSGSFR
jgi:Protein of unknown function (DUF1573)